MVYSKDRIYGGSGLMQFYEDSTKTDLRTVAALMITYSDNVASLWSQELAGGGEEINKVMQGLGLKHTRMKFKNAGQGKDMGEIWVGANYPTGDGIYFNKNEEQGIDKFCG